MLRTERNSLVARASLKLYRNLFEATLAISILKIKWNAKESTYQGYMV